MKTVARRITIAPMKELYQGELSSDAEKARELAWLRGHLVAFWLMAHEGHREHGRGAVVIDTTTNPLGEDTPFYYIPQARFEAQEDEVSLGLIKLISEYGLASQFVAVFIRPRNDELEFSMFQIGVTKRLVEAINAYDSLGGHCPKGSPLVSQNGSMLLTWKL